MGTIWGILREMWKKDLYGNVIRPFKEMNRKPIVADEAELAQK